MHFHWLLIINASLPVPPRMGSCLFCCAGSGWAPHAAAAGLCLHGPATVGERCFSCQADPVSSGSWKELSVVIIHHHLLGRKRMMKLQCQHCCQRQRGVAGVGRGHGQGPGTSGTSSLFRSITAVGV